MNFSAILDISSFFIGMIINLLLIALICYYFKRKYENLEIAQNEQAKVLYQLLQQNSNVQPKVINLNDLLKKDTDIRNEVKIVDDSDSDESYSDDSDSDSDSESEEPNEIKRIVLNTETINLNTEVDIESEVIEEINVDFKSVDEVVEELDKKDLTHENDYSKMTIKQLKDALSVKGINANKMKKNEMIELIEKTKIVVEKSPLSIDE
jgi:hypothetical protein